MRKKSKGTNIKGNLTCVFYVPKHILEKMSLILYTRYKRFVLPFMSSEKSRNYAEGKNFP